MDTPTPDTLTKKITYKPSTRGREIVSSMYLLYIYIFKKKKGIEKGETEENLIILLPIQ